MLLVGPPQMVMVLPPFFEKEPLIVGCKTRIGTGDTTLTMAAVADATIFEVEGPPTNRINPFGRVRVIFTRIRVTGSVVDKVTPAAEVGKSTVTTSFEPLPNPFARA